MCRMTEKITPTVITGQIHFGRLLRLLRTIFGWSQRHAGEVYSCVPALVSLRERGTRALTVEQAVDVLGAHGYVLVLMHGEDATQLPRLRGGGYEQPLYERQPVDA